MTETGETKKPKRLIEKVKKVVQWFEWQEWTLDDLFLALDAHGMEGQYNKGAVKSAIIPTLKNQNFIRQIKGANPATYAQVGEAYKGGKGKTKKDYTVQWVLSAVLVSADRPLFTSEIGDRIEKLTGNKWSESRLYTSVSRLYKKGWLTRTRPQLAKRKSNAYELTAKFYTANMSKRWKIGAAISELNDTIHEKFDAFGGAHSPKQTDEKPTPPTEETQPPQPQQNPDAPIDWDLPENRFSAADVGAAVIEYIHRLQLNQKRSKSNATINIEVERLHRKNEELAANVISKDAQLKEKDRTIKSLKRRLSEAEDTAKEQLAEINKYKIEMASREPGAPRTSFKLSEVAAIKNAIEDGGENIFHVRKRA